MKEKENNYGPWETPSITVYGGVDELTKTIKHKTFGAGDDVLVDNLSILASLS